MWEREGSVGSSTDSGSAELYEKLERVKNEHEKKGLNESLMTLNMNFDWEENKGAESVHSLNLSEGLEMQDTMGGHTDTASLVVKTPPSMKRNKFIERAITSTNLA